MDRELYADLIEALLSGEDDDKVLAILAPLNLEELQDLDLAAGSLRQLCRIAAEQADDAPTG